MPRHHFLFIDILSTTDLKTSTSVRSFSFSTLSFWLSVCSAEFIPWCSCKPIMVCFAAVSSCLPPSMIFCRFSNSAAWRLFWFFRSVSCLLLWVTLLIIPAFSWQLLFSCSFSSSMVPASALFLFSASANWSRYCWMLVLDCSALFYSPHTSQLAAFLLLPSPSSPTS